MEITRLDEHHEALLFWEEAVSSGKIRKAATLLHVDAHSDLATPRITESVYSDNLAAFARRQLDITNFIVPALMRGIFKEIIFLSRGIGIEKRQRYYIGSLGGKGVWINKGLVKDKPTGRLYPDLKQWHFSVIDDAASIKIKNVVLDIDLDYFYGYLFPQPRLKLRLTKPQIKELKKLSLTEGKYKLPLCFFNVKGAVLKPYSVTKFKHIVYNDSKQWIECTIRYFVESLKIRPELISICRSVKSGYVPGKYAEYAEQTLIKYLAGRQKRNIDPCDITSAFKIYPFIRCLGNTIYNPLTDTRIKLKQDSRFIWQRIRRGKNFPQIFRAALKVYDIEPELLKKKIFRFISRLKSSFIIK